MPDNVHIITYGCSNNIAESRIMENLLLDAGFVISDYAKADLIIVNSCSVKSVTENRIIHKLREMEKEKKIVIAGCMPEAEYDVLREAAPSAALLSTHHIDEVASVAKATLQGEYVEVLGKARLDKSIMTRQRANKVVDIIPISSGCRSFCSFCSTKIAKGDLFSFPEENIIESMKKSVAEGTKEFWITSQDNGCYGFDRGSDISKLIFRILGEVEGDYRMRIGMMNPEHLKRYLSDMVEAYRDGRVFRFIHLPVQSGSDAVLKNMRRRYTAEEFVSTIKTIRESIPDVTIWTDMICGFPEESQEDFDASMRLLRELKFDFSNVSAFGNRPLTAAAKMRQVPTEVKKFRTREMSALVEETSLNANKKWIGWSGPVLVDEYNASKNTWIGRNFAYKPVVLSGDFNLGDEVSVKIKDVTTNSLFA